MVTAVALGREQKVGRTQQQRVCHLKSGKNDRYRITGSSLPTRCTPCLVAGLTTAGDVDHIGTEESSEIGRTDLSPLHQIRRRKKQTEPKSLQRPPVSSLPKPTFLNKEPATPSCGDAAEGRVLRRLPSRARPSLHAVAASLARRVGLRQGSIQHRRHNGHGSWSTSCHAS